jgi:DNA-binding MarR family transcriptional regulator
MRSKREHDNSLEGALYQELNVLTELVRTPQTSQRSVAQRAGIALGVTNLIVRQLARKGYMRARRAGWRRWIYTLTPKGISRRTELAGAYVQHQLKHFRQAKVLLQELLVADGLHAESHVAVLGTGELAELVYLVLKDLGVDEIDIFRSAVDRQTGVAGVSAASEAGFRPELYDRIIIASLVDEDGEQRQVERLGIPREKLVRLFNPSSESAETQGEPATDDHGRQAVSEVLDEQFGPAASPLEGS